MCIQFAEEKRCSKICQISFIKGGNHAPICVLVWNPWYKRRENRLSSKQISPDNGQNLFLQWNLQYLSNERIILIKLFKKLKSLIIGMIKMEPEIFYSVEIQSEVIGYHWQIEYVFCQKQTWIFSSNEFRLLSYYLNSFLKCIWERINCKNEKKTGFS